MTIATPDLKPTDDLPEVDAQVYEWVDSAGAHIAAYQDSLAQLPERLRRLKREGELKQADALHAAAQERERRFIGLTASLAAKEKMLKDQTGLFRRPKSPESVEDYEFAIQNLRESIKRLDDGAESENDAIRRHHRGEIKTATGNLKHETEVQGWHSLIDALKTCQDGMIQADPMRVMRLHVPSYDEAQTEIDKHYPQARLDQAPLSALSPLDLSRRPVADFIEDLAMMRAQTRSELWQDGQAMQGFRPLQDLVFDAQVKLLALHMGGRRFLGRNGIDEVIEQMAKGVATEVLSDPSVDGKLGEYRRQLIEASQHQRQPRPGQAYEQHYAYEHHQEYASTESYNQDPPNPFR